MTVREVQFDKKEQLQKIQAALLPSEFVEAVFDVKGVGPVLSELPATE
jgi:hypothetical protein